MRVDFNVPLNGSAPPTILVLPFLDIYVKVLSLVAVQLPILNGPVGFFRVDLVLPFSVDKRHSVDQNSQFISSYGHLHVLLRHTLIQKDEHFHVLHHRKSTSKV